MTRARTRLNPEALAEARREVYGEMMDALEESSDFGEFKDRMAEKNPSLPGLSVEDIKGFTVEDHIQHKQAVDALMSGNPEARSPAPSPPPGATPPRATGTDVGYASGDDGGTLTMEMIRRMSPEAINKNWDSVQAVMKRSGT